MYVQRDSLGNINGAFAGPQPGYATEFLAANDPALVAFLAPKPLPPPPVMSLLTPSEAAAFVNHLASVGVITTSRATQIVGQAKVLV